MASGVLWAGLGGGAAGGAVTLAVAAYANLRDPGKVSNTGEAVEFMTTLDPEAARSAVRAATAQSKYRLLSQTPERLVLTKGGPLAGPTRFIVEIRAADERSSIIAVSAVAGGIPTQRAGLGRARDACAGELESAVERYSAMPTGNLEPVAREVTPQQRRLIAATAVILAVALAALSAFAFTYEPSQSRVEKAMAEVFEPIAAMPEFRTRFADVSARDAFAAGAALVQDGLKRVDVATLERFHRSRAELLAALDARNCAHFETDPDRHAMEKALGQVSDDSLVKYLRVHSELFRAALEARPLAPALTSAEAEDAQRAFSTLLTADQLSVVQDPASHSDSDVCAVIRDLYRNALSLADLERGLVLRLSYQR